MCRRWFRPQVYEGNRQRVCGTPECQRERHRRSCAAWHARHPGWERDGRLRKRLVKVESEAPAVGTDPRAQIDWDVVRDAVGPEVCAVIEETAGVLVRWTRDAVAPQGFGITSGSLRLLPAILRDDIASFGPSCQGPP